MKETFICQLQEIIIRFDISLVYDVFTFTSSGISSLTSFCSWWTYQRKKFCSRFFLTRSNGKSVRMGGRDWPKDEGSRVLSVSTSRKESIRFVICLLWGFLFYVFRNFLSEVPDLFDGLLVLIFLSWGSVSRRGVRIKKIWKQAGAVLGQAQLKLGFDFNLINLHWIDEQDRLLPRLTIQQYQ